MTKQNTIRFFSILFITVFSFYNASAQTEVTGVLKSRLSIVATDTKTNIWVSDFPKSTSVVLFDEADNLITIVSTNEFGAAFVSLPEGFTKTIFAKTMNGEISVSNKATISQKVQEHNVASTSEQTNNIKA